MRTDRRSRKTENVLRHRQPDLTVVFENLHDPHNVSAVLRTCDAVGVLGVYLVYNEDTFPKLGKKSSASAIKWISRKKFTDIDTCYEELRQNGFTILATMTGDHAQSLYEFDLTKKIAFVLGNENRGVSDEAAEKADGMLRIPMFGMLESLNVSVAGAIILFECLRQRLLQGAYRAPKLTDDEYRSLYESWIRK